MKKLLSYYNCSNKDEFITNTLNKFCEIKINSDRCKKFYNNIIEKEDNIYTCPYGFNCIKANGKIYNCLLIKGEYSLPKIKRKKDDKQKCFEVEEIYKYIEVDNENEQNIINYENSFDNMSDFLHDITKVNKLIEGCSKNISTVNLSKKDKAKRESIIHLSDFITKRIDLYRYVSNPEIIKIGRKRERDAYKLWDIYRYIFAEIGYSKNISIEMKKYNLDGVEINSASTLFMASDSITALPFLLIDNAIKYSKDNSIVKIEFYQDNNMLKKIDVCSTSSYKIDENPKKFLERGYRAVNNTSKSSGSGLGLSIVKQICEFNDISISIDITYNAQNEQCFKVNLEVKND